MGIDRIQMWFAHQSGHEHQEGRLRQVEIGHQPIRNLKLKPRINENIRIPLERPKAPAARGRLDQAQSGRTHRE